MVNETKEPHKLFVDEARKLANNGGTLEEYYSLYKDFNLLCESHSEDVKSKLSISFCLMLEDFSMIDDQINVFLELAKEFNLTSEEVFKKTILTGGAKELRAYMDKNYKLVDPANKHVYNVPDEDKKKVYDDFKNILRKYLK